MSGVRLEERLAVRVPQLHRLVLAACYAVVTVDIVTDSSHGALCSVSTFLLFRTRRLSSSAFDIANDIGIEIFKIIRGSLAEKTYVFTVFRQ